MIEKGSVRYRREVRGMWRFMGAWCDWILTMNADIEVRPRSPGARRYIHGRIRRRKVLDLFVVKGA